MWSGSVISHQIILSDTLESAYNKIKRALEYKQKLDFPSLQYRGKYVVFIEKVPSEKIQAYIYDNTGFVLFDDNYLVSTLIDINLRKIGYDVIIDISMTPEPSPSKYTTQYDREKVIEFDNSKIRIYWADTIYGIREYLRLETSKEIMRELYPPQLLIERLNDFQIVQEKFLKFLRELVFSFQFVMIFPLLGTFAFVYYDRGEYAWQMIWLILLIGPILYVVLYPFYWFKVKSEKEHIKSIMEKVEH